MILYVFTADRLGKISNSLTRNFKDDVSSEVAAVRDAGEKERNAQELSLVRRLNDSKKDNITELVSIATNLVGPQELKPSSSSPIV